MYFIIRFDWNKLDSTRSNDRIVGCFDTVTNARNTINKILPYDEYRNAVAIVHFPINEVLCCGEPDEVYVYSDQYARYMQTNEPYIGNQYFYM